MKAAGYAKNGAGTVGEGRPVAQGAGSGPQFFAPLAPPVAAQLKKAGFDAAEMIEPPGSTALLEDQLTGKADTIFGVHCGSLSEPYETLKDLHSKIASAGRREVPVRRRALLAVQQPEYDELIDQMEAMPPGKPDDPKYMELATRALDIYLTRHAGDHAGRRAARRDFNHTYWTGWPSAEDPYVAPYPPWEAWRLIVHRIQPAK